MILNKNYTPFLTYKLVSWRVGNHNSSPGVRDYIYMYCSSQIHYSPQSNLTETKTCIWITKKYTFDGVYWKPRPRNRQIWTDSGVYCNTTTTTTTILSRRFPRLPKNRCHNQSSAFLRHFDCSYSNGDQRPDEDNSASRSSISGSCLRRVQWLTRFHVRLFN